MLRTSNSYLGRTVPLCVYSWGEAGVFVLALLATRAIVRIREEWNELQGGKLFFGSLLWKT